MVLKYNGPAHKAAITNSALFTHISSRHISYGLYDLRRLPHPFYWKESDKTKERVLYRAKIIQDLSVSEVRKLYSMRRLNDRAQAALDEISTIKPKLEDKRSQVEKYMRSLAD